MEPSPIAPLLPLYIILQYILMPTNSVLKKVGACTRHALFDLEAFSKLGDIGRRPLDDSHQRGYHILKFRTYSISVQKKYGACYYNSINRCGEMR